MLHGRDDRVSRLDELYNKLVLGTDLEVKVVPLKEMCHRYRREGTFIFMQFVRRSEPWSFVIPTPKAPDESPIIPMMAMQHAFAIYNLSTMKPMKSRWGQVELYEPTASEVKNAEHVHDWGEIEAQLDLDFHNFGRQVKPHRSGGGIQVLKSRAVSAQPFTLDMSKMKIL